MVYFKQMKINFVNNRAGTVVGVDISEDRITAAVVRLGPVPEIKEIETRPVSKAASDEELSGILKEIFTQKGLPKKEVWLNIGIYSQSLSISRASLPSMSEKDISEAIKWNLKDKLSFDINTAEFTHEAIGEVQKEDGSKTYDYIACAAERPFLDRYLNIFKQAGIALAGINVSPFSISNVLTSGLSPSGKTGSAIVCSVDSEHTSLCFYQDGALNFVRQIPLGSASFLNAMTGVLASDKGKVELNYEDAKKIIKEIGIAKDTDNILEGKVTANQLIALIRPVVEQFTGEITRSIDYYQREFNANKVDALLLTGEGADMKGFVKLVSEYISLKVEPLKLLESSLSLAAVGAALGHGKKINLMPVEIKAEKNQAMTKTMIRVASVAVFGILLVSFLTVTAQIKNYRKELEVIKKQRGILADVKDIRDKIAERQAIITGITQKDVPMDLVMKELSNVTPGNIAFSQLWMNRSQYILKIIGRVSAKPEDVQDALSDFMTKLEKTSLIGDANLLNVQKEAAASEEISDFEINCDFKR